MAAVAGLQLPVVAPLRGNAALGRTKSVRSLARSLRVSARAAKGEGSDGVTKAVMATVAVRVVRARQSLAPSVRHTRLRRGGGGHLCSWSAPTTALESCRITLTLLPLSPGDFAGHPGCALRAGGRRCRIRARCARGSQSMASGRAVGALVSSRASRAPPRSRPPQSR